MEVALINQNQTDARYELSEDDIVQTLTARCGTGGGHVQMVILFAGERRNTPIVLSDASRTQEEDGGMKDGLPKR